MVDFIHNLKDDITSAGAIISPSASEATLKDMGQWMTYFHLELITSPQQTKAQLNYRKASNYIGVINNSIAY